MFSRSASAQSVPDSLKPAVDELPLWNVIAGFWACRALEIAHDRKLFMRLADGPLAIDELARAMNMKRRPVAALLSVCTAAGLLRLTDGRYELTPVSRTYLLESSTHYFGAFMDSMIANDRARSFARLKEAVVSNRTQAFGADALKSHPDSIPLAQSFTRGMHGHSAGAAYAWPHIVDLSGCRTLLDIGGGSGVHSIGAVSSWPDLRAIVLDAAPVCRVAEGYIANAGRQDRIQTHAGDLWKDAFPESDVHFFSDVYHDWSPDKNRYLTRKSFESLPKGGRIIIHEMLFNEEKTGPLIVAASSFSMLLWNEGEQYSAGDLSTMLTEGGFVDIEVRPSLGEWSLVTARKP